MVKRKTMEEHGAELVIDYYRPTQRAVRHLGCRSTPRSAAQHSAVDYRPPFISCHPLHLGRVSPSQALKHGAARTAGSSPYLQVSVRDI